MPRSENLNNASAGYRAGKARTVPQNFNYYLKSYDNHYAQHEFGDGKLEFAVERFNRYAAAFFVEHCPELLTWLNQRARKVQAYKAEEEKLYRPTAQGGTQEWEWDTPSQER